MSKTTRTMTVFLDHDYTPEELEPVLGALRMVRGVAAVEPRGLASVDYMARRTASLILREKALEALTTVFDVNEQ